MAFPRPSRVDREFIRGIFMPDGQGGSRRLTYAQLAEARGYQQSAERLVHNRKWPRVLGNDGVAIVIVPPAKPPPEPPPD